MVRAAQQAAGCRRTGSIGLCGHGICHQHHSSRNAIHWEAPDLGQGTLRLRVIWLWQDGRSGLSNSERSMENPTSASARL